MLPDMFTNKLGLDDEGVLGFVDEVGGRATS
jgi:hypothetical protein